MTSADKEPNKGIAATLGKAIGIALVTAATALILSGTAWAVVSIWRAIFTTC